MMLAETDSGTDSDSDSKSDGYIVRCRTHWLGLPVCVQDKNPSLNVYPSPSLAIILLSHNTTVTVKLYVHNLQRQEMNGSRWCGWKRIVQSQVWFVLNEKHDLFQGNEEQEERNGLQKRGSIHSQCFYYWINCWPRRLIISKCVMKIVCRCFCILMFTLRPN